MTTQEGFQIAEHIFVSAGILMGGIWTIIIYFHLKQPLKSKLERENLKRKPSLSFHMELINTKIKEGHLVFCTVEITNTGNQNTGLDLDEAPLSVYEIYFKKDGTPQRNPPIKQNYKLKNLIISDSVVDASAKKRISFVTKIMSTGTYEFEFTCGLDKKSEKDFYKHRAGKTDLDGVTWGTQKYIHLD